MVLYGSHALRHCFPDFKRIPKDFDYLLDEAEYQQFKTEKWEKKKNDERYEYCRIPPLDKYVDYANDTHLSANVIYTLKLSHIFWDIFWDKHIYDIQFLKNKGCEVMPSLFNELYIYWTEFHGKKRRENFERSNEEFFADNVKREVEHDELHEAIKVYEYPMFKYIKDDLSRAEISEEKFIELNEYDKFLVVQEEACVLAYERYISKGGIKNIRVAYTRALKDLLLRLTPLWLGLFIADNYTKLNKPHINYKEKIENYEF